MGEQSKDRPGASIPDMASEYGVSEALLYGLANRGNSLVVEGLAKDSSYTAPPLRIG